MRFLRDPAMEGTAVFIAIIAMLLQYPQHFDWLLPLFITFMALLYVGHRYSPPDKDIPRTADTMRKSIVRGIITRLLSVLKNWLTPALAILIVLVSGAFTVVGIVRHFHSPEDKTSVQPNGQGPLGVPTGDTRIVGTTLTPVVATPTPDARLFSDDFDAGSYGTGWRFLSEPPSISFGRLHLVGSLEAYIGDSSWTDYMLLLDGFSLSGVSDVDRSKQIEILVRVQDRDNFMLFRCIEEEEWGDFICTWYKVVGGIETEIPEASLKIDLYSTYEDNLLRLDMEENIYRTFINARQVLRFADNTYSNGYVGLRLSDVSFKLGAIEVRPLP